MSRFLCLQLSLLILALLSRHTYPFVSIRSPECLNRIRTSDSNALGLYKLEKELPLLEHMPLKSREWDFHLLEPHDLKAAAELALECFYSPRITLSLAGMTGPERWIWGGIIDFYSTVDKTDTRQGNYLGMRSRSGNRLWNPSLSLNTNSFILVATPAGPSVNGKNPEIAAIVEICVEAPGGKLAPPIANPFRPKAAKLEEQPYLCNLCVGKAFRRKGLGKLLCELSEELVQIHWDKNIMFLHVEQSNTAAQALYLGMGYELVTPGLSAWEKKMEGIENILYYSNDLKRKWDGREVDQLADMGVSKGLQSMEVDADSVLLGIDRLDFAVASNIMRSKS